MSLNCTLKKFQSGKQFNFQDFQFLSFPTPLIILKCAQSVIISSFSWKWLIQLGHLCSKGETPLTQHNFSTRCLKVMWGLWVLTVAPSTVREVPLCTDARAGFSRSYTATRDVAKGCLSSPTLCKGDKILLLKQPQNKSPKHTTEQNDDDAQII